MDLIGACRAPSFTRLLHADWSMHPGGRQVASASRDGWVWIVGTVEPVGDASRFLERLFDPGEVTLAGFDFPIGVPLGFGRATGLRDFPDLLDRLGAPPWQDFLDVADHAEDIRLQRPFFKRGVVRARDGVRFRQLIDGLPYGELTRECERLAGASSLFWTVGAKQVGKAAIEGWQSVIRPALRRGGRLWPFAGGLSELASPGRPVLAETYPGAAYAPLGIIFRRGMRKGSQADRAALAGALLEHASGPGIRFTSALTAAIRDGFGSSRHGGDAFDAVVGLLSMIRALRQSAPAAGFDRSWEGWIFGLAR